MVDGIAAVNGMAGRILQGKDPHIRWTLGAE
jgi:hypothetical protein